jgi:hypothetical protein
LRQLLIKRLRGGPEFARQGVQAQAEITGPGGCRRDFGSAERTDQRVRLQPEELRDAQTNGVPAHGLGARPVVESGEIRTLT